MNRMVVYKIPRSVKADFPESPSQYFRYSPLIGFFQSMVVVAWWLSLVEYAKLFAVWLAWQSAEVDFRTLIPSKDTKSTRIALIRFRLKKVRAFRSFAIDLYEIAKWATVVLFISYDIQKQPALILTMYLLASNLFSHFYYHLWKNISLGRRMGPMQSRRRFLSFILALFFSFVAYSYIFSFYQSSFDWPGEEFSAVSSLFFSVSNAFTLVYGNIGPNGALGYFLAVSQVAYTFFFVVLIIAQSIPKKEKPGRK